MNKQVSEKSLFFATILYVAAACCLIVANLLSPFSASASTFLLWTFLAFIGRCFNFQIKVGSISIQVCLVATINLAAFLTFGLPFMLWISLAGTSIHYYLLRRKLSIKPEYLHRYATTCGIFTVAYSIAAWSLLSVHMKLESMPALILSALLFQFLYTVVAAFLFDAFQSLDENIPLKKILAFELEEYLPTNLSEIFLQPMIAIVTTAIYAAQPWAILLVGIPFYGLKLVMDYRIEIDKELVHTVEALSEALDAKDDYTDRHTARVKQYAEIIAKYAGLSENQISKIGWEAKLHDVGKIFVKEEVLRKTSALTNEEYEHIKVHVQLDPILVPLSETKNPISEIIGIGRLHHERFDGKGYPFGLKGAEIPLNARIIAVADTWDAMTSRRVYRKNFTERKALDILRKGMGKQWDPKIVKAFMKGYESGEIKKVNACYNLWLLKKEKETEEHIEKLLLLGA